MKALILALSIVCLSSCSHLPLGSLYPAAVRLSSPKGSCSGTQIVAPSGSLYILTAGHCADLAEDGVIWADHDSKAIPRKVIEVSNDSDLMLVEALPDVAGIEVAEDEPIRGLTFTAWTHGRGYNTYRSTGDMIQTKTVKVMTSVIESDDDEAACKSHPKNIVEEIPFIFGSVRACLLHINAYVAQMTGIAPGSSGGTVLNPDGELTGVAFAGDGTFSMFVTLPDIHRFLQGY